jgi:fused signal recognition particle receptor
MKMENQENKKSFLRGLKDGLARTRSVFKKRIDTVVSGGKNKAEIAEGLEEALIAADLGIETSIDIVEKIQRKLTSSSLANKEEVENALKELIVEELRKCQGNLEFSTSPFVIMAIGINGVGKTTTIGKLSQNFTDRRKKVLLAGADTFRAAAIEQLEIWGERTGTDVIKQARGTDPGAVAFDAVRAAKAREADILIVDTAGRLHTKTNLMDELKKVKKVLGKEMEGAPHEILLVLDATTGQNALVQARMFHEAIDVTGLALVKLDGTAKGGIIIAIARELKIPIRYIGLGEGVKDLRNFDPKEFVEALF